MGNIEFLIPKTYNFFQMSENFILYIGVLLIFAIKTNYSDKDKEAFKKKQNNVYYLSIGSLSILMILTTHIFLNKVDKWQIILTTLLYAVIFLSKNFFFNLRLFKYTFLINKIANTIISLMVGKKNEILPIKKEDQNDEKTSFKI